MISEAYQDPYDSRVVDRFGAALGAYDLVRIVNMPKWELYERDEGERRHAIFSRGFVGGYGLIVYQNLRGADGRFNWSGQPDLVSVLACKANHADKSISVFDFVLSSDCVEKIPFSVVIMSVFARIDWNIIWNIKDEIGKLGKSSADTPNLTKNEEHMNILCGRLYAVVSAPYEVLCSINSTVEAELRKLSQDERD